MIHFYAISAGLVVQSVTVVEVPEGFVLYSILGAWEVSWWHECSTQGSWVQTHIRSVLLTWSESICIKETTMIVNFYFLSVSNHKQLSFDWQKKDQGSDRYLVFGLNIFYSWQRIGQSKKAWCLVLFLYYCPHCPKGPAHLNSIGWATLAIWSAIKKYSDFCWFTPPHSCAAQRFLRLCAGI